MVARRHGRSPRAASAQQPQTSFSPKRCVQPSLPTKRAAEPALSFHIAAVCAWRQFAHDDGLVAYFGTEVDIYRRTAVFVDKILRGAKPAELPVEQPTRFELVLNLKTAKAIGLTIPPTLLARADEVIE